MKTGLWMHDDTAQAAKYLSTEDGVLAVETYAIIRAVTAYATRNFGPQCEEFCAGCANCEMWARRDAFVSHATYCCL